MSMNEKPGVTEQSGVGSRSLLINVGEKINVLSLSLWYANPSS